MPYSEGYKAIHHKPPKPPVEPKEPDLVVSTGKPERTECRWFQRHSWGKWVETDKRERYNIYTDEVNEYHFYFRRTCKYCGCIQFKKVVQSL